MSIISSRRSTIILMLVIALTLTFSQSAYAVDTEKTTGDNGNNAAADKPSTAKDKGGDSSTSSPDSDSDSADVSQKDNPKTSQQETPKAEPEPKPTTEHPTCDGTVADCQEKSRTTTEQPSVPNSELPKCDGSFKDCITRNGDTCKAGEGGEKCECLPDNSDCPNNPNVVNPPVVSNPIIPAIHQPVTPGPDNDCLFHPELPKCKSDNGVCPDGFFQNENENCVPQHDRCPKGFHSHEDDETGRCIPDSVPCEPGFIRDPDFPTCSSKASVCRDHPELKVCGGKGEGNDGSGTNHNNNNGGHSTSVVVVHKTKVIHKTDLPKLPTVFVKGLGLVEPFNCILNKDKAKIGCEFILVKVIN